MTRPSARQAGTLFLALVTILAGCGGAADGFSGSRGTVSGKATLAGKPLPSGCQVLFMATRGGFTASGTVGPEGAFSLQYLVPTGLPVGDYVVQLAAPATAASGTSADPSEMARRMNLSARGKPDDDLPFPARYTTTATSGLAFTVQPGTNTFDLALTP